MCENSSHTHQYVLTLQIKWSSESKNLIIWKIRIKPFHWKLTWRRQGTPMFPDVLCFRAVPRKTVMTLKMVVYLLQICCEMKAESLHSIMTWMIFILSQFESHFSDLVKWCKETLNIRQKRITTTVSQKVRPPSL